MTSEMSLHHDMQEDRRDAIVAELDTIWHDYRTKGSGRKLDEGQANAVYKHARTLAFVWSRCSVDYMKECDEDDKNFSSLGTNRQKRAGLEMRSWVLAKKVVEALQELDEPDLQGVASGHFIEKEARDLLNRDQNPLHLNRSFEDRLWNEEL